MTLKIITLVLWGICGLINLLLPGEVLKRNYFCCWFSLMIILLARGIA